MKLLICLLFISRKTLPVPNQTAGVSEVKRCQRRSSDGTIWYVVSGGLVLDRPHPQGGSSLSRCYRDTKMEIQGLCATQNLQSQHGGPRKSVPSLLRSTAVALSEIISTGTEGDGVQSDRNNNSRPRTSQFHLLVEHGSGATCSSLIRPQLVDRPGFLSPCLDNMALNAKKEPEPRELLGPTGSVTIPWKNEESAIKMALSLFDGDDELVGQPNLTAMLREQCADAAQGHYCLNGHGVATGVTGDSITSAVTKEQLDVFNADGSQNRTKHRAEASVSTRGGQDETERTRAANEGSTEAGNCCHSIFCYSLENQKPERQPGPKAEPGRVLLHHCASAANASRAGSQNTVEHVVVANNYSDMIRGHSSSQNSEGKVAGDLDQGVGLVTAMDSSDFFSTVSPGVPTSETFSGIITINNQNIIVTLESGVLTLAAPQEGCVHREDDVLTIKEHLGMKDHEDIVLLNYESRTKSIGKIGTLTVTSSGPQDEPRPGFSDSGSELALVDGCSVSELSPSLDSGPVVKPEAAVLCAVTEEALVTPPTKVPDCTTGDFRSIPLIRSKKETPATFSCQEPGCSCVFDTRQKLKVHLLNHAEDPRPYQCTVEGCGWAFGTSYKLKRHLQSHDKQRPHTCQFEGCGRRFTTIYNLKAHIKVHEQDNTFICEICSERFRSATRLANHQRVHFEPQRPHKCEFPGSPEDMSAGHMQT